MTQINNASTYRNFSALPTLKTAGDGAYWRLRLGRGACAWREHNLFVYRRLERDTQRHELGHRSGPTSCGGAIALKKASLGGKLDAAQYWPRFCFINVVSYLGLSAYEKI
jgi:hypothetical protein